MGVNPTTSIIRPDGLMRNANARLARLRRDSRVRVLTWATLATLVIGVLELAGPVEDHLRATRNLLRTHPPSGEIVVAAINDESSVQLGEWPWPRRVQAKLIDKLHAAGARRITYDLLFTTRSNDVDDRAFAAALKRAGNVYLEAGETNDQLTSKKSLQLPLPMFRKHVGLVSTTVFYRHNGQIKTLRHTTRTAVGDIPLMSSVMADRQGSYNDSYRIDYAVDLSAILTFNVSDIISGRVSPSNFRGKDVVVAFSRTTTDRYYVQGKGYVNGAYVLIAGAETLKKGRQTDIGWWAPLAASFLLLCAYLRMQQIWLRRGTVVLGLGGLLILPIWGENNGIYADIMPGFILLGSVSAWRAWATFKTSYKVRGDINATSGLPNLNALRRARLLPDAVLIGARINNYAEISSSLPPQDERALVEQIANRLALGASGAAIYQGDEGIFVWVTTADHADPDHLDALHALFRSPALIRKRPIDLTVTFGVDAHSDRELANRIGATLVAADEAAAEGLRWKTYDPSKLADAEWKLSLLGRLDAAIDTGEIWVAYQPQLDLTTGRLSGAEALVRWSHPEKGEVSPAEFVVAAEQHDRIDGLTRFVLKDAIALAAEFNARGVRFEVAVNISARLLERPGLTTMVSEMLANARLAPEFLTLEVTESAAMTSGRTAIRTLEELGSLGISISIDDYGTGFSTLEYLKLIPAAEVKIDRSFTSAVERSASDRMMVKSTVELAHSLGRTVVAEGVETAEMLAALRTMGCDKAQGYFIGRPMRASQLKSLFQSRKEPRAA